jgi:hypothetical protein
MQVFPIRTSSNLVDWRVTGAVFPGTSHPGWAAPPFYAPEIHAVRTVHTRESGAESQKLTYWAVYDATEVETGIMAIGAAWSNHPTGPFTDLGKPLMRGIGGVRH